MNAKSVSSPALVVSPAISAVRCHEDRMFIHSQLENRSLFPIRRVSRSFFKVLEDHVFTAEDDY